MVCELGKVRLGAGGRGALPSAAGKGSLPTVIKMRAPDAFPSLCRSKGRA